MRIEELEQLIHEYIMDIYNIRYIGKLTIHKLNPIGYSIAFGMNCPECPDIIYGELEDAAFKKFLKEEIKTRNFGHVSYGTISLTMPPECNSIDKSCSCYDKRRIN